MPDLVRGRSTRCKPCALTSRTARLDLGGKKHGLLTPVRLDKKMGRGWAWECRCDCGNTVSVLGSLLVQGHTTSCGCLARRKGPANPRWKGHGDIPGTTWLNIVNRAKRLPHEFALTVEEAWAAFERQQGVCALSGLPLKFGPFGTPANTASLDRVDSGRGYCPGNVQWVHKHVNEMKWSLPQERFVELCRLVTTPITREAVPPPSAPKARGNRWKGCGDLPRTYWCRVTKHLVRHGRTLALGVTIDEAWALYQEQAGRCALTGLPLSFDPPTASFDRVDSARGYEPGNVQWLHKDVNQMKHDFDQAYFREMCARVARRSAIGIAA